MERKAFVVSTFCWRDHTRELDHYVAVAVESRSKEGWKVVSAETRVSSIDLDNTWGAYLVTTIVIERPER